MSTILKLINIPALFFSWAIILGIKIEGFKSKNPNSFVKISKLLGRIS